MPPRPRTVVLCSVLAAIAAGVAAAPLAGAATGCSVTYRVTNQWPGGFGAEVTVTNLGDPINGWTLAWSFPAGQQVTQAWNATVPTGTSTVTATNAGHNATIPTNGSTGFGFNGTWSGSNPSPTAFTLNGTPCTGATNPTTAPTMTTPPTRTTPPTTLPNQGTPAVTRLSETTLDPSALFFISYDGIVNNASYQQSGILTHAGHQYTAWYTGNRQAVLARRALPNGAWEKLTLPHSLTTNDSHNSISLGVSPSDGRLHIGMDTHDSAIFYVKSEAALVSSPAGKSWTASRFGAVQRSLDGLSLGNMTYPRFVVTGDNRLQFSYRTGGSGNGTLELAEYRNGTWTKLGRWSSATGNYTNRGVTSTTRNMYLHGLTYGPNGRLHATFTWREGNTGVLCNSGGLANHDTGYAYSDDLGRTWRNNAGTVIGTTGGTLVSVNSPGHVVDPLDPDHALINQESQAVDSTNQPHAIISYVPGRFGQCVTNFVSQRIANGRAFHVWRDSAGTWRKMEIPVAPGAFGRSRLVFDRFDNAYVVMPFGRIVTASKASNWSDWTLRFDGGLNAFGEVVVDESRVRAEGILSVLYQERSSGSTPSPIHVVDFRLG